MSIESKRDAFYQMLTCYLTEADLEKNNFDRLEVLRYAVRETRRSSATRYRAAKLFFEDLRHSHDYEALVNEVQAADGLAILKYMDPAIIDECLNEEFSR